MNNRVIRQAVGVGIVFLALVWLVNSKIFSIDQILHAALLRVIGLGLLSIILMVFGVAQAKKRHAEMKKVLEVSGTGQILVAIAVGIAVVIFILRPYYEELEANRLALMKVQMNNQAMYSKAHPDDTTIVFVAKTDTFGKSWTIPREFWKGYGMEINATELDVPYIIATQAVIDTIRPSTKIKRLGIVQTLAFKSLGDSALKIKVRFFRN